jgi:hypothetical protein
MCATGDEVAFFDTGGTMIALFAWAKAAREAGVAEQPRPAAFRGVTLAWNCQDRAEVDAVLAFALNHGAKLLKPAAPTDYGGYAGLFCRSRWSCLGGCRSTWHSGRRRPAGASTGLAALRDS